MKTINSIASQCMVGTPIEEYWLEELNRRMPGNTEDGVQYQVLKATYRVTEEPLPLSLTSGEKKTEPFIHVELILQRMEESPLNMDIPLGPLGSMKVNKQAGRMGYSLLSTVSEFFKELSEELDK